MQGGTVVLLLGLVLCASTAQAQDKKASTDVVSAMNNNGHKLAAAIFDVAGVTKIAQNPKARYTLLLPTDAAVEKFLKDMGLTLDDLKKRPVLAKQLVAQHMLNKANVREQDIFEKGETRKAATLAAMTGLGMGKEDIEFKRTAPGKFTVTDPQGNVANIVGKPIQPDENKTIYSIDKVLMGDQYYTSFDDVCKQRKMVTAFCDAVKTAGLGDALTPSKLDATVFVPTNDAFKKATDKGTPSKEALTTILKYHVVPGARELPKQWKNDASFKTLEGKDLKVNYVRKSAAGTKRKYDWAEARVIPVSGTPVPVLRSNVHVGKAVVHGIGSVLDPNAGSTVATEKGATTTGAAPAAPAKTEKGATTTAPATPAAPAKTEKDATTTATTPAAPGTEKGATTTAPATPAAPAKKTGSRKLLQAGFGWGMTGGPTAEADDIGGQITNVVDGNESAAQAANQGTLQAEELSVPGDYNQVENGINPW